MAEFDKTVNDETPLSNEETVDETVNASAEETKEAQETTEDTEKAENTEAEAETEGKEKKFGKKLGKTDKEKEQLKEKVAELEAERIRQLAEFQNFRNRTEREKQQMFDMGAKNIIEKVLPIVDNFERGLATVPEDKMEDAFVIGMNGIYKQLLDELDKAGVKPMNAVGQEFDPNLHNAVMQVESEEYESGIVAQELQKGYLYHDSVVRHAMVAVVQ